MKIRVLLATAVAAGLCGNTYAAPPSELFPSQAKVSATGPYGLTALEGTLDLRGPISGSRQIILKLPNRRAVRLERTFFENRASGNALWQGEIAEHASSQALLTVHQGVLFGRVALDGDLYEIRPGKNGQYILEQLDPVAFPDCDSAEEQFDSGGGSTASSGDSVSAGPVEVIDLLSVYTANARVSSGGVAAIEALIQSAVDVSNAAFIESNMNVRYRLVHTEEVAFNNAGSTSEALTWVTDDSSVANLREQTGADMVSILVDSPSSCGTAWVQRNPGPGFAGYAFQATDVDCAVGNLTFAHEHGHNMGMEHNVENSSVGSDPTQASHEFSFGHYIDGSFRTVMSYQNQCASGCTRVARFSNPGVSYAGLATGVVGQSNNAETGRLTAPIIRDFQPSVVTGDSFINVRVAQSGDDVEESTANGNVLFDSTDLEFGYDSASTVTSEQLVGLRFLNVGIPQDATVTSAYLEFTVDEPGTAATTATIRIIDEDSAEAFGASAFSVSSRPTTGEQLWEIPAWETSGELKRSPDIAALVQAVVDRPDWASGNSLAFTVSATGERTGEAWDGVAEAAPLLHVEFDTGSSPSNIDPSASFSFSAADLVASFSDASTDADGNIVSWMWDFGDNNSAAVSDPIHAYDASGNYQVTLTVMDDQGATDATSQSILITEPASSTAPAAPSSLQKVVQQSGKGKNKTITAVSLQWSDNSNNETEFVIESCLETTTGKGKNRTVSCSWSEYVNVGANETSTDVSTTPDYKYRVRARNSVGTSEPSNEVKI